MENIIGRREGYSDVRAHSEKTASRERSPIKSCRVAPQNMWDCLPLAVNRLYLQREQGNRTCSVFACFIASFSLFIGYAYYVPNKQREGGNKTRKSKRSDLTNDPAAHRNAHQRVDINNDNMKVLLAAPAKLTAGFLSWFV